MISEEKLDRLQERLATIEKEMAENPDRERYIQLSRDHAELAPIAERVGTLKAYRKELAEAQQLADDSGSDPALRDLALSECAMLEEKIVQLNECLRIDLLPKDQADSRDVIIEIRAGTGGDEAALFAGDLFRMYQRYAETQKWLFEVVSLSEGELGGIKEVVSSIAGTGVYGKLKFESGVHRVQRVPQTESSGRIHTSAATVAVLPQAEEVDISINDQDLRIDTFRASGAGGQHVNTTDSAVRITHLPTGIVVAVQDERSQHKNKAKALKLLRAKLFDAERARSQGERDQNRRIQIGSGDRSERIRTYNFPQGRVTDHRINLTLYKIAVIIDGEGLDELIEALIIEQNTRLLTAGEAD